MCVYECRQEDTLYEDKYKTLQTLWFVKLGAYFLFARCGLLSTFEFCF